MITKYRAVRRAARAWQARPAGGAPGLQVQAKEEPERAAGETSDPDGRRAGGGSREEASTAQSCSGRTLAPGTPVRAAWAHCCRSPCL